MVTPSLRIAFLKGPRDGDTLQYTPGSTIRVGRIVRGNEIAVKDAGISTKHLRIASVSSGNWAIQDLGSSNGTLLNSIALDPDTPVDLRDGDVVEIGECTSMVVNFVIDVQEQKLPPLRPRRNNKRQANADPDPVRVKPAGKRTIASELGEEEKGLDVKIEIKLSSRVRKGRKIEGSEKLGIWGTRNVEIVEESSCLGLVNTEKDETLAGGAAEEALKEKRITRATRIKKDETVGDSYLDLEMALNRGRKRCGKSKKAEKKPLKSFEHGEETDAGEQDPSCSVEVDTKTKSVVDMVMGVNPGKLTLGEWFSSLEVHLPKQINHETESVIEPMRSKTQRVREYIAEQRKVQAKAFVLN